MSPQHRVCWSDYCVHVIYKSDYVYVLFILVLILRLQRYFQVAYFYIVFEEVMKQITSIDFIFKIAILNCNGPHYFVNGKEVNCLYIENACNRCF